MGPGAAYSRHHPAVLVTRVQPIGGTERSLYLKGENRPRQTLMLSSFGSPTSMLWHVCIAGSSFYPLSSMFDPGRQRRYYNPMMRLFCRPSFALQPIFLWHTLITSLSLSPSQSRSNCRIFLYSQILRRHAEGFTQHCMTEKGRERV